MLSKDQRKALRATMAQLHVPVVSRAKLLEAVEHLVGATTHHSTQQLDRLQAKVEAYELAENTRAQLGPHFPKVDFTTWPREAVDRFCRCANEELLRLCEQIRELKLTGLKQQLHSYITPQPLTESDLVGIKMRALDEFGVGKAEGQLWEQILMRETARTVLAKAQGAQA